MGCGFDMDKLWRLMSAVFMIVAAVGLFLIGWTFSNGMFNTVFSALILYAVLFLVVAGIVRGLWAIISHHFEKKE